MAPLIAVVIVMIATKIEDVSNGHFHGTTPLLKVTRAQCSYSRQQRGSQSVAPATDAFIKFHYPITFTYAITA